MNNDITNILPGLNKEVEQEKLLRYLNRNMTDAEQHEFEKSIADDPFAEDALDGLEHLKNRTEIPSLTQQLNFQLKKELKKRNKGRNKYKGIPSQQWTYYAILLILLIAIVTYVVIKKL